MKPSINLRVTPSLAQRLRSTIDSMPLKDPVIAVALHRRDGSTEQRLGVGVYERANLGDDAVIVEVDRLKFYVDPSMEALLSSGTLDVVDGEITIV